MINDDQDPQDKPVSIEFDTSYSAELKGPPSEGLFTDDSLPLTAARLNAVESMLRLLTKNVKYGEFVREILLIIMKVVTSEAGSILEVDQKSGNLFFRSVVGQSAERIAKFLIPMGKGIVGYVAESRQPLVVANVKENEVHLKSIQHAVGFETRDLIAIPIVIRGKVYGVLELLNRVGGDGYTPSDVENLTYLCDMAGRAIEIRLMLAWNNQSGSQTHQQQGQGSAA
ncbi:MAG: GAF domain-containing protein [Bdellovibrionota bacterium]